mgnify:CR=1 FL=1
MVEIQRSDCIRFLKNGSVVLEELLSGAINSNIEEVKIETHNIIRITSTCVLTMASRIKAISHTYIIREIKGVKFYNQYQQWVTVKKNDDLTAFHFLFLELETNTHEFIYLYNTRPFTLSINFSAGQVRMTIIHDAPFLHPTWDYSSGFKVSTAAKLFNVGEKFTAVFYIYRSEYRKTSWLPSFYPGQCEATIIMTDHSDFDAVDKLREFLYGQNNDGWINKGLKYTKGVFCFSPLPEEQRKSDDLEIGDYKRLIDILYNDGSEVCPHALKHSGQISAEQFQLGLRVLSTYYNPTTWIDHGSYLKYCYSQNGHLNEDYRLLDTLSNYSYSSLWSYHDINLDPTLSLNFFHKKKYNFLFGIWWILRHILKGNLPFALHYIRSFIYKNIGRSLISEFSKYFITCFRILIRSNAQERRGFITSLKFFFARLAKFSYNKSSADRILNPKDINRYLSPVFTVDHKSLNNYNGGLLFFNTVEATHIKDIYTKKSLEKLISERGLHIGHTYILNNLPYLNGIFDLKRSSVTLSDSWIQFISALSQKVRENKIWNPTMGKFIERVQRILNIDIHIIIGGLLIINNNESPIHDFKIFIGSDGYKVLNLGPGQCVKLDLV